MGIRHRRRGLAREGDPNAHCEIGEKLSQAIQTKKRNSIQTNHVDRNKLSKFSVEFALAFDEISAAGL